MTRIDRGTPATPRWMDGKRIGGLLALALATGWMAAACTSTEKAETAPPITYEASPVDLEGGEPAIRTFNRYTFEVGEFLEGHRIENHRLQGTGVVYDLPATGDTLSGDDDEDQKLIDQVRLLREQDLIPPAITPIMFVDARAAIVTVWGRYPENPRSGERFDIYIEPLGNASELKFGRLAVSLFDTHPSSLRQDYVAYAVDDMSLSERVGNGGRLRIPNGGTLLRDLPTDRTSQTTVRLTLTGASEEIRDAIGTAIDQAYDHYVVPGGSDSTRLVVNLSDGAKPEEFIEQLRVLTFSIAPFEPIVVLNNRTDSIDIVGGPVPLQRRWISTAHIPKSADELAAEEADAATNSDNDGTTAAAPRPDRAADRGGVRGSIGLERLMFQPPVERNEAMMTSVPYIVTPGSDEFDDLIGYAGPNGRDPSLASDAERRASRFENSIRSARSLQIVAWRRAGQSAEIWPIERNDLALLLATLRDELALPAFELKDFLQEAQTAGQLVLSIHERMPRMINSQDRTVAYLESTRRLMIGTETLDLVVADDAIEGTTDGTIGLWRLRSSEGRPLSRDTINDIGPYLGVIEGAEFRWRDAQGGRHVRTIRLDQETIDTLLGERLDAIKRQLRNDLGTTESQLRLVAQELEDTGDERLKVWADRFREEADKIAAQQTERIDDPDAPNSPIVSTDSTFTWYPQAGRIGFGGTLLPGAIQPEQRSDGETELVARVDGSALTLDEATTWIELADLLDGSTFLWRVGDTDQTRERQMRVPASTLESIARRHIELLTIAHREGDRSALVLLSAQARVFATHSDPLFRQLAPAYESAATRLENE